MITAEAMKEFDMTKEERDSYADIILYQSKKLTSLADEILAGAKLEKKGISLEDTIDLKKLLVDVAESYKNKAAVHYTGETIVFKGNESHFERAIINVFDNAIKYNESAVSKVDVNTAIKEGIIEISIADNGPGITDAYKAKVFDQFYRIPTGNIHNVKGYGLGLSYVKKVVQAHKGSITIKDNQPSGSMFTIRIPYET
jgi:signal transduction histidine kinase